MASNYFPQQVIAVGSIPTSDRIKSYISKAKERTRIMAKTKYVTRTIKSIKVKFLAVDTNIRSTEEFEVIIPYTKKEAEIMEMVKEIFETENMKVAAIIGTEVTENKYKMTEQHFIAESTIVE